MKKINRSSIGYVRFISGKWRGKKLPVIESTELRPTKDMARETLFNWLNPFIVGSHCLDCFAGTGILGLEAISRYAASATLLEIENKIFHQLQNIVTLLEICNVEVININTIKYLDKFGIPYNIVFVDPPFYKKLLKKTLILLEQKGWLAKDSIIYIETDYRNNSLYIPYNWKLYRKKIIGNVAYRLFISK